MVIIEFWPLSNTDHILFSWIRCVCTRKNIFLQASYWKNIDRPNCQVPHTCKPKTLQSYHWWCQEWVLCFHILPDNSFLKNTHTLLPNLHETENKLWHSLTIRFPYMLVINNTKQIAKCMHRVSKLLPLWMVSGLLNEVFVGFKWDEIQWTGKHGKGSCLDIFLSIIQTFNWKDSGKPIRTSVRTANVSVKLKLGPYWVQVRQACAVSNFPVNFTIDAMSISPFQKIQMALWIVLLFSTFMDFLQLCQCR
jgi:hypothetical protein